MKMAHDPDFTTTIHEHINEVPRKEWDSIVCNTMFCTCVWLELLENSLREDVSPHYITITHKNSLAGVGVCYVTHGKLFNVHIVRVACMFPFSEEMAFFMKEGEDNLTIFSLLHDAVEKVAAEHHAQLIFVPYADERYTDFFKKRGFSIQKEVPTTYLDVQWKTFKEYLGSLTRKAKKNIRHTLNQGKNKGLRLEHSQNFQDTDHLFTIYAANLERHGYEHAVPFTGELFKNFQKHVPECTYIVRCLHESDLLGYWIYFFDGSVATMAFSGIDYKYEKEYDAYFNICYDAVREMIERGCKKILFGTTTYEVKRRIGCSLRRTVTPVKFMNPVLSFGSKAVTVWRNFLVERTYPE